MARRSVLEIEGAELVGSLEEALKAAGDLEDDHLWVIGGGSVVVKDIPDNSVAVGNPCRVIRHL